MAITPTQLDAATEALGLALKFDRPADTVLHEFFGARRALGARDRAFIADAVYGVLRRKRTVEYLAPGGAPRRMLLAWLTRMSGISVRDLAGLLKPDEAAWLAQMKAAPLDSLPLGVRADLPDWLVERLASRLSEQELVTFARGLNEPAPLDLRVNTLSAARDEVREALAADGVVAEPTPFSPLGLRIRGRPAINRHELFLSGAIEVQDEGSQLLGFLLAPRRHDLVVDFCAGAGGKSLMLGALMSSHGRIYAFDVSSQRLSRLKPRLKRSGLSNIYAQPIKNENDLRIKRLTGKIDRVLVDAPCSGFGTLRRNPDLKWRHGPQAIDELAAKQRAILAAAARLLKPGGRLVYATCSILSEENDAVVADFRRQHEEYATLSCAELFAAQRIPLDTGERLRLFPHLHATDGFYAAAFVKNSSGKRP
jgi:16S rRNA (cytosine967-C5)-methyltransferase